MDGKTSSWVGKSEVVVQASIGVIKSEFYLLNLKDETASQIGGELFYLSGTIVALNSAIYAIGNMENMRECFGELGRRTTPPPGYEYDALSVYHIHKGMSVLDLKRSPRPTWHSSSGTNHPRCVPSCVTLNGKIYAFDGTGIPLVNNNSNPVFVGEVYDPVIRKWFGIPPPTDTDVFHEDSMISWPLISDPKNNRLLVHFRVISALFAYYPDNILGDQWKCLHKDISLPGSYYPAPEVLDDVIYMLSYDGISAYDIRTNEFLEVSWSSTFGDDAIPTCITSKCIFHLGNGVLCLADSHYYYGKTVFRLKRFTAERISPGQVRLTPLQLHSISVQGGELAAKFVPL